MNKHIEENLKRYLKQKDPEYAVLLTGKWGSGKTYFIDEFIKGCEKDDEKKFIKISLFGLKKLESIDEQIFQNLHPLLGSKSAVFTGNLLKSALKFGFKFDWDNDNKSDGKVSVDPKGFNPLDFLSDTKKSKKELIFIFDDLERTDIELIEILGYINYLVEQSNFKVIILANETKILEEDKNSNKYREFKEKVIGKTFEIQQDFDAVFQHFLEILPKSKQNLQDNKEQIKKVYFKANYDNLRHIRQTMLDFEYFYENIDEKYVKHQLFIRELIYLFFALSIEIKKGNLTINNFGKYIDDSYISELNDEEFEKELDEEKKTEFELILHKYSIAKHGTNGIIFSEQLWSHVLFSGKVDKNEIEKQILLTTHFKNDETASWIQLWHLLSVDDTEFQELLDDVKDKFLKNNYQEHEDLLQVIALLLMLSKKGLYKKSENELVKQAKKNIDKCMKTDLWKKEKYGYRWHGSKYSLGFSDEGSENFQKVLKYLIEKSEEAYNSDLPNKAKELLEVIDDFDILNDKLYKKFNKEPIFSKMKVEDFIDKIITVEHSNNNLYYALESFKERYQVHHLHNVDFSTELIFWEEVKNRILESVDKKKKPITYYILNGFKKNTLKEIIENLIKSKQNLS